MLTTRRDQFRPAAALALTAALALLAWGSAKAENPAPRAPEGAVTAKKRWHPQEMFALSKIDRAPVVMLGDSHTQRAAWNEITGCRFVINRGIGGDVSAGVLRRLDDVTNLKPSAVFLMIGINDISRNVPTETIVDNVRQTIERLNEAGAKVYLTLVLPVTRGYVPRMNPRVGELDAAYIALAERMKATVVDFRQEMRGEEGALRNDLSVDGLHLSPEGYRIWRDAVTPLVAQHCQTGALVAQTKVATRPGRATVAPQAEPAPPAPVADMTASISRGDWIIQVGAYPEQDKVQARIREVRDLGRELLAGATPFSETVIKGSQTLYRVRFAGFDQNSAEAACSHLKRHAIDCIAMKK